MNNWYLPTSRFFLNAALIILISLSAACKKGSSPEKEPEPYNGTVTYTIHKADGTEFDADELTINTVGDSVKILVPATTDVTSLIPEIKAEGAAINPNSGIKQDFSKPVTYTITKNGATKIYVFSVRFDKLKNLVYFGGDDKNFYALNAKNGKLIWKYTSKGVFSYSTPVLVNGTIYTTNTDYNLYALDPASGAEKWKFTATSAILSSPVVANGIVYFGSDAGYIYAVDAISGTLKWKYGTDHYVESNPVVSNGVVYIGGTDGFLYAFDGTTGNIKWKYDTGNVILRSNAIISNGVVFIGNREGNLYAVNAATGQLKWKFSTDEISLELAKPVINNGIIYLASWYSANHSTEPGSLYAIKESDGSQIWKGLRGQGFKSGPVYADGKLFINSDDSNIYAVDAVTGTPIWKKTILSNGDIPTVSNGNVYSGGGGSHFFYTLNANTGTEIWKFPLPNDLNVSKPLVIDSNGNY